MYGIVNQAIKGLIVENFGQEKWETILRQSRVSEEFFLSNESYPDHITYDLAITSSKVLGLSLSEVLISFGEYWVLRSGAQKYGTLLAAGGKTFKEFIINLPNFHSRIMLMYPNLKPPSFKVDEIQDRSICLHYISFRPGLKDFVVGLIYGLGKMYDTKVKVETIQSRDTGFDHEVFRIEW